MNQQLLKIEIEALNKVKKTDLSIVKIDKDTKEIVPGAKLKIKGIEPWNNHIEIEVITKEEPVILNIPVGRVAITEEEAPEGYHLSDELVVTELIENEAAIVEFENDKIDGEISIVKVDAETKEPLAGVEFKITCVEGFDKGKTWNEITNDEGKILKNALYGVYEITEVAPLWNYVTNGEVFTVEINEEGQVVEIEVENKKIYGEVELIKKDAETGRVFNGEVFTVEINEEGQVVEIEVENKKIYGEVELIKKDAETGRVLEGVEFELYNGNTLVGIYKTDKNGKIKVIKLEAGNYYFKEISNDGNYIISDEQIYFEIKEDKQVIELEVLNKVKEGEVDFSKTDVSTGELIEGATIHIKGLDEQNDKNGKIKVIKLEAGNYYFKEISNDGNYIISDEQIYFEIKEDKQVIELEVLNKVKEGEVDFSKTDVSTGELIEGATIHIKGLDEQNSHIDFEFVSAKEETRFKLPVGRYEFAETVAPNGYVLNEEIGYFEILENEVIKAELKNKRIEGTLEFEKTDVSTGEVIEGAHIKIECVEGFNKGQVIEFVSSKDGNKFKLEYGKYIISETISPEGYELTTETSEFEISEDGQIVKAELKNKRIEVPVLPHTGGMNSEAVIGIALVISLAGAIMFRKKKAN